MSFDDNSFSPGPTAPDAATPLASQPAGAAKRELPQDLRAPWNWLDLLVIAFLAFLGSLLLNILLTRVFGAFGIGPAQRRASPSEMGLFTILHQALLNFALLGYLAAQIRLIIGLPFWRTIGWRKLETGNAPRALRNLGFVASGFLLAAFVLVFSAAFGNRTKLPIQALYQDRRTTLLLLLMAVVVAPVIEETIFRGYIYPVVARSFGTATGVLATGIFFGLLHAPQLWGGWVQIVALVVVGIVFTYVRAVTRTVVSSYLVHLSYNVVTSFAFLLGTHWLRRIPPAH